MSTASTAPRQALDSLEELLVHAIALEEEAVERYEEMADSLETHNNMETAELLRRLAGYGRKHAAEMRERAEGLTLPHIAPWDYKWGTEDSPETAALEDAHYLMTPYHAMLIAHRAESNARGFYAGVAATSRNESVAKLAQEFADEEAEHVALLEKWIEAQIPPPPDWAEDPDPPNIPE
ncbi:ferritin family protein [Magnetospira sp. QH-2]|uniref:ferritin-like domain-containing protein n=1 Tax=Magnetospira sp. (strain QH-2) TaxID=1288970 RepID=UPI0003E8119C|nr:ferritin family protein [Magnetospira sp. QH-2]CCQ72395.1 Rubrerythrin [Magnetospira sp. QH-2]